MTFTLEGAQDATPSKSFSLDGAKDADTSTEEPKDTGVRGAIQELGSLWPKSATPTDIVLIPAAIGGEGLMLRGAEALTDVATRAMPRVAQTIAETPEISGALNLGKIAGAGATGWGATGAGAGAVNAKPGERIKGAIEGGKSGAEMGAEYGAGGAVVGKTIGKGYETGKGLLQGKSLPKTTADIQNAAKAAGFQITGKTPEEINNQIQDWFKGANEKTANKVSEGASSSEVWPMGKSFAISKNYDKAGAVVTKSYKAAEQLGKNEHVDAEPVVEGLKNIITDMEKKAEENVHIPQYASTLAQFKRLYKEIAEGKPSSVILDQNGQPLKTAIPSTVTANKLVEIKQALNRYYVSAPKMTSGDVPYARLSGVVQNSIKNTAPKFQEAITKANNEWTEFTNVYRDNDVLKQFWTPEDHDAFKALTERNIAIPPETQKRVYKMLDKIKTPADLESLKLAMKDSPKEYDSIRAAKFYDIMDKAGLDAKAIDKNYDVIIKSLEGDTKAQEMVDAVKTMVEQLNQREIGNISPAAAAQRDNAITRSIRYVINNTIGGKLAFAKKISDVMKPEEASVTQERLKKLKSEVNKKQPFKITITPRDKFPLMEAIGGHSAPVVGKISDTGTKEQDNQ